MKKGSRLLITGGSGFVGRHIAEKALLQGYEVVNLDLVKHQIKGVEYVRGDTTKMPDVERAFKGVEYVIHLAAITVGTEFEKNAQRCFEVNVGGFNNVIAAALRHKVRRFAYASSSYVYGDTFSDQTPVDIQRIKNPYAKSKIINEMMAESYRDVYGMDVLGLRFFNVYGNGENTKGEYTSIVTKFFNYLKKGEPVVVYGDGSQAKDMIYAEDAAAIALKLLQYGNSDIYNVGTGKEIRYRDVATWISPKNVTYVPNPLKHYQTFTKADTRKLLGTIGPYKFMGVREFVNEKLDEIRRSKRGPA